MTIGHKAKFIELVPSLPSEVPSKCLFVDSTNNNTPTYKNEYGVPGEIGTTQGSSSLFVKTMEAGGLFLINRPLSKKSDGTVILLDSDDPESNIFCAYSMEAATFIGQQVSVLCIGANVVGAVSGMGFLPGEEIFIGESGEYVNSVSGFTGANDTIIKVGVADCSAGAASPVATDLIAFASVIAYP